MKKYSSMGMDTKKSAEPPSRFEPFFGGAYLEEFERRKQSGRLTDRMLTHQLGDTPVGNMVRNNTALESLTLLKLPFLIKKMPEAIARVRAERADRQMWQEFSEQLRKAGGQKKDFSVLQIGAYDGVTSDRMYPLITGQQWRACVVEPLPDHFQALQAAYASYPQVTCVRAAVTDTDGQVEMTRYDPKSNSLPAYVQRMSTTRPEVVLPTVGQFCDVSTVVETVPSQTLGTLLNHLEQPSFDLLFVDAEGCDYDILSQVADGAMPWPQFIVLEHNHMSDDEFADTLTTLTQNDYRLAIQAHDVLAARDII